MLAVSRDNKQENGKYCLGLSGYYPNVGQAKGKQHYMRAFKDCVMQDLEIPKSS